MANLCEDVIVRMRSAHSTSSFENKLELIVHGDPIVLQHPFCMWDAAAPFAVNSCRPPSKLGSFLFFKIASAIGLLHVFPVHTNKMRCNVFASLQDLM